MSTLRDDLLPVVDEIRGIPDDMGLSLYTVEVVKRVWDGTRVGLGSSADSSLSLKVSLGTFSVQVTMLKQQELIASGGLYQQADLKIGPITPPYTGSRANNSDITDFDPEVTATPTELFFKITGPGYEDGAWFKKIGQDVTKAFRYTFIVRKTGEVL